MRKTILSGALWFLAIGWALNYVAAIAGLPQLPGLLVAALVAVLIALRTSRMAMPGTIRTARSDLTSRVPARVAGAGHL